MLPSHIVPAPNSDTGKTLAFVAVGLSILVGLGTLIYLRHQVKLVKMQIDHHEKTTGSSATPNAKSPA